MGQRAGLKCIEFGLLVYGEDIYAGHPVPNGSAGICTNADRERFRQMVFRTWPIE